MKQLIIPFTFLALFFYILFIHFYYLSGIPHVPDDTAYIFMGKMFAKGRINTKIPIPGSAVDFFPGILDVNHGTWLFQYPFGHPMLLAIGFLLGIPHLIIPGIAVLTIFLLHRIAKIIFKDNTAYFLLLLPFLSPFFLENSASFMSHPTSALYVTAGLYSYIKYRAEKRVMFVFFCGICIGLLFNTRPLTSLPFLLVFLLLFLREHKDRAKNFMLYSGGFGILFLLWCLYNLKTTGLPFASQYFLVNQQLFGVYDHVTFAAFLLQRLSNTWILFQNLIPMLLNLPFFVSLGVCILPFCFKDKYQRFNFFLLFCCLLLPLVYFFYNGTFLMYGPRFWYETLPFVFLLVSRGLALLYNTYQKITILLCVLMTIVSLGRFFSVIPISSPDFFSPLEARSLKGFNFTDTRIKDAVQKSAIHNAVVFVDDCLGNWWCYGSVFSENSPSLNSDVVYVKNIPGVNTQVMNHFPGRTFYQIDYSNPKPQRIY